MADNTAQPGNSPVDPPWDAEAVLSALMSHAPDIILYVDVNGIIRFINRVVPGFEADGVVGTSWLEYVEPGQREPLTQAFRRALEEGSQVGCEVLAHGAHSAPVWYWSRIGPVRRDGVVVGAVVVARDLSEKRNVEAQLMVADRLASMGMLATGIAHEINNPLASALTNLHLSLQDVAQLRGRLACSEQLLEQLSDAREALEHVGDLARDLRVFSRQDHESRRPVDVHDVLDSALRLASHEIRSRARVVKSYLDVPLVLATESRLGQVFLNLIVNAAQALSPERGTQHEIRITTETDASHVTVRVSDTGSGIAPEFAERVFHQGFTTKPVGVGTGLGLLVCRRIVEGFGGKIEFSSRPGLGTVFSVSLPVARGERRPEEKG